MKIIPDKVKYKKPHKQKTFAGIKGQSLTLFTAGLQVKSNCTLSFTQLESTRRVIVRLLKAKKVLNRKNLKIIQSMRKKGLYAGKKRRKTRKKYLIFKANITAALTKKPLQVRMGKGKGNPYKYVALMRKSRVILEISRQKYTLQRMKYLFAYSSLKLPTNVKFIYNKSFSRIENNFKVKPCYFKGF